MADSDAMSRATSWDDRAVDRLHSVTIATSSNAANDSTDAAIYSALAIWFCPVVMSPIWVRLSVAMAAHRVAAAEYLSDVDASSARHRADRHLSDRAMSRRRAAVRKVSRDKAS